jgi:hypothetical protein
MKIVRNKAAAITLMTGLLIFTGLSRAEASDYLGAFCWNVSVGGQIEKNMKLAVTNMGGGHYILNGTITDISDTTVVSTAHGNAELVGNKVIGTLNASSADQGWVSISTWNLNMDMPSLNGIINAIGQDYSKGKGAFEPLDHTEGALTSIPCP